MLYIIYIVTHICNTYKSIYEYIITVPNTNIMNITLTY